MAPGEAQKTHQPKVYQPLRCDCADPYPYWSARGFWLRRGRPQAPPRFPGRFARTLYWVRHDDLDGRVIDQPRRYRKIVTRARLGRKTHCQDVAQVQTRLRTL